MESQKPPTVQLGPDPCWTAQTQQTLAAVRPTRHALSGEQLEEGRAALRESARRTRLPAGGA